MKSKTSLNFFFYIDKPEFQSGTTATVCLLRDGIELVIGHVGDSRAILCREGYAIRLSEDFTNNSLSLYERLIINERECGVT
jgi:protein phosphatase 1K